LCLFDQPPSAPAVVGVSA
jgi:hypothetical protein